jgi:hypothetical protein
VSQSVSISAVKPPDDLWRKHKAVWDACHDARVDMPAATMEYFAEDDPDEVGVVVRLGSMPPYGAYEEPLRQVESEWSTICEVDITQLPEGTRWIRVEWG